MSHLRLWCTVMLEQLGGTVVSNHAKTVTIDYLVIFHKINTQQHKIAIIVPQDSKMVAKQHRLAYRLQHTGALILKTNYYAIHSCVSILQQLRANQNQGPEACGFPYKLVATEVRWSCSLVRPRGERPRLLGALPSSSTCLLGALPSSSTCLLGALIGSFKTGSGEKPFELAC